MFKCVLSRFSSTNLLSSWAVPSINCYTWLFTTGAGLSIFPFYASWGFCPLISPAEVPLDSSMTLWHISHSSQMSAISEFPEGALCSIIPIAPEMLHRSIDPWGALLAAVLTSGFEFSSVFSPHFVSFFVKTLQETVGSLNEVQVDKIHCPLSTQQQSHSITGSIWLAEHDVPLVNPC